MPPTNQHNDYLSPKSSKQDRYKITDDTINKTTNKIIKNTKDLSKASKSESILNKKDLYQLVKLFNRKYSQYLNNRSFHIVIDNDDDQDLFSCEVTLSNSDNSFYYPVQGKIKYDQDPDLKLEASFLLIDFIDQYYCQYFASDEQVLIPIDWTEHVFEGYTLYIKGQIFNKKIDDLANNFLDGDLNFDQDSDHSLK